MPLHHTAAEVAALLGDRIDQLVPILLPNARLAGKWWECGGLDGRPGGKSWQLKINRTANNGYEAGSWHEFGTDLHGDALNLVQHTLCNGDASQAYRWSLDWLGLGGRPLTAVERRKNEQERQKRRQEQQQQQAELRQQKIRQAQAIFHSAQPIMGTPAEDYLANRGIHLSELARPPKSLRFSWEVWSQERRAVLPAMVAAIARPGEGITAVHRTYLERIGGRWSKADMVNPKMVLGPAAGSLISLARGQTNKPLPKMELGELVAISEGIEDGLTVAMFRPELRVVCGMDLGKIGRIIDGFPMIQNVLLIGQNDPPGSDAEKAFGRVVESLARAGCTVRLARPPQAFKDFNDWQQAKEKGEA